MRYLVECIKVLTYKKEVWIIAESETEAESKGLSQCFYGEDLDDDEYFANVMDSEDEEE